MRLSAVEQPAQVGAQQVPRKEVRFATVLAVDDETTGATRLEQRLEHLEVLEIGEHVLALVGAERDRLVVVEVLRRIRGVSGERVQRGVVTHPTTVRRGAFTLDRLPQPVNSFLSGAG